MTGKIAVNNIQTDLQGNIYISGEFMDTLRIDSLNYIANTGSGFNLNNFLIKLNETGYVVWKKNISALYQNNITLQTIKIKNNFLYAGLLSYNSNSYIKKFDLSGNEILSISIYPVTSITGIDVDLQGNIYAAGSCFNGNIQFANINAAAPFSYDDYFVKFTSSGSGAWVRFVEDITVNQVDVVCDPSGNMFACGQLFGPFMFGNIQAQGPAWVYDFYITKIDPSGNFLWLREVPNATPPANGDATKGKSNSIALDGQNNIYFTGFLRYSINWGNNVITSSIGGNDLLILKYNTNGNILWGKTAGGSGNERGDAISLDNQGNIFISGNLNLTATFDTITINGTGYINSYAAKLSNNVTSVSTNNEIIKEYTLNNYPNPFNPVTKINYSLPKQGLVILKVYDILGKEIITIVNQYMNAGNYSVEFDGSNLSSGVYFYRLLASDYSGTGKMILNK